MLSARILISASRFDQARTSTGHAIRIAEEHLGTAFTNRDLADLYILQGDIELGLYEWDQSLDAYNIAIEFAPDYADAYFHRGVLYYSILQTGLSTREAALNDFEYYLEIAPDGQLAEEAAAYANSIRQAIEALENETQD